jgi:hypothetical protein
MKKNRDKAPTQKIAVETIPNISTASDFIDSLMQDRANAGRIERYLRNKSLFGYNWWYLARNPNKLFLFAWRTARWNVVTFYQRGRRGYGDSDLWSFDSYLTTMIPAALKTFKEKNIGYPCSLTPEEWDEILDKIILGFENHTTKIQDWSYDPEKDPEWKETWKLFRKWFNHIWW